MKRYLKRLLVYLFVFTILCLMGCNDNQSETSSEERDASVNSISNGTSNAATNGLTTDARAETGGASDTTAAASSTGVTFTEASETAAGSAAPSSSDYTLALNQLAGDRSEELLRNPNRGFRLESYMNVESGEVTSSLYDSEGNYTPENGVEALSYLYNLLYEYKKESPTVVQMYFYLTEYRDKDLDQTAFDNMNRMFQFCRKYKITLALRFSYIFNQTYDSKQDTTTAQLLRHIDQLKSVIAENRDVICWLEAGFVGAWGEWEPNSRHLTNGYGSTILTAVTNMIPDNMYALVRYASRRDSDDLTAAVKSRLGYHDDYIVGYSHVWCTGSYWNTDIFSIYEANSLNVPVGGEMPWGAEGESYDGWGVVKYLSSCHFTVLSCYHSYREGGGVYSMKQWQNIEVTASVLQAKNLRYYDGWFKDSNGNAITRNLYEYIRDYLGYCVAASDLTVQTRGTDVAANFKLTNYGFSKPLTMQGISLVLLDAGGNIVSSKAICDMSELAPGETRDCSVSLSRPEATTAYRIGILFNDYAGTGAMLANDVTMVNGVNVLGVLD